MPKRKGKPNGKAAKKESSAAKRQRQSEPVELLINTMLPNETLVKIFDYIPLKENFGKVAGVCERWEECLSAICSTRKFICLAECGDALRVSDVKLNHYNLSNY